jgi:NAD(P)-dependent dehydrogenase (short-subunit alcohol dehydrogenase family)
MAAEFAERGWRVFGTVRAADTPLHSLAARRPDIIQIETIKLTNHGQMLALRDGLSARKFNIVFVNRGIANRTPIDTMANVSTEEFVRVMVTNVLGVTRPSGTTRI